MTFNLEFCRLNKQFSKCKRPITLHSNW